MNEAAMGYPIPKPGERDRFAPSAADAKHTPGPWHVASNEELRRVRGALCDDRPIAVNKGSYVLAAVWGGPTIVHNEDICKANAHLIAAAPDLLAACVAMLRYLDDTSIAQPARKWQALHDSTELARAAIAKYNG